MISFALFVWFTKCFVWPPINKALTDRQAKIADGLAAAEKGHLELQLAQENAVKKIKDGQEKASKIILNAQKHADQIIEEARVKAHDEGARIIEQAHQEIEQMVLDAKESLKKQVTAIALLGAERLLEKSVDEKTHIKMLDKLAEEI